ncbi:MAG: glycosyltransferase family 39 protein [Phycisphaerae bacterium]|nr:glycosyltransferase family 39 protein [Phycisphaerae bacterium]
MARRRIHPKSAAPQVTATLRNASPPVGLFVALTATLLIGGIPFAMGKYIELNSPDPFDGGAYAYSAQRLLTGARLWVDEISSAQPGTLLCNIFGVRLFGFSDAGPNIIQMLLQLGGLAMLFYTVRRLFGNIAAVVSTALAAIMLSAPIIAKFGNVKEQFMIPFAIVAACAFALHETGGKKHWAIIAGAASICPFYFKPTGIAIVVAVGLYLAVKLIALHRRWKAIFLTVALWVLGAVVGLLFPASLYIWQNNLSAFWKTFPVVLLEGILLFSALAFAAFAACHHIPWKRLGTALRTVNRNVYLYGTITLAVILLFSIGLIALTEGSNVKTDLPAYLKSIPFGRAPLQSVTFLKAQIVRVIDYSGLMAEGGYVGYSRKARPLAQQAPQVFRYYNAIGAAVYPALATTLLIAGIWLWRLMKKKKADNPLHAVAAFLAVWWLIDMTLVWISPHSYEQYYLPPCASGAMLIASAVWYWNVWLTRSSNKLFSLAAAGTSLLVLFILIFPVFAGFSKSPDTGAEYKNVQTGQPERRRGFAQSLAVVRAQTTAPWQAVGDHVRSNSTPDETLYVWGWFPGIYVRAERMAPVPRAFEADMHVSPPAVLKRQINTLIGRFENNPPKFLVDSRKQHFPFDGRPPFELWPIVPPNMFGNAQPRLLKNDPTEIEAFENAYADMLRQRFGQEEALRFEAMKPFRDFVMSRYRFAGQFENHMLFEQKD